MEVSITKMSSNGQVVVPSEIRKDAKISPSTKFLIFNKGGNIILKQLRKETLEKEFQLVEKILKSETQIKKGKYTKVDSSMSDNYIDEKLMN